MIIGIVIRNLKVIICLVKDKRRLCWCAPTTVKPQKMCEKNITNIINVTNNINAVKPLEDLCINSRVYYNLPKSSNPNFQKKKSWNIGCPKRKETLSECEFSCNYPNKRMLWYNMCQKFMFWRRMLRC